MLIFIRRRLASWCLPPIFKSRRDFATKPGVAAGYPGEKYRDLSNAKGVVEEGVAMKAFGP